MHVSVEHQRRPERKKRVRVGMGDTCFFFANSAMTKQAKDFSALKYRTANIFLCKQLMQIFLRRKIKLKLFFSRKKNQRIFFLDQKNKAEHIFFMFFA